MKKQDLKSLRKTMYSWTDFSYGKVTYELTKEERILILNLIDRETQRIKTVSKPKVTNYDVRHICSTCKHCRPTRDGFNRGCYECTNKRSKFYKSLLNIDLDGEILDQIVGEGCTKWERKR